VVAVVLGRYGDTRVDPRVLFDVDDIDGGPDAGPPLEAIDVQLRCPVSLSVLLDGMRQAGLDRELDEWDRAYRDLVTETVAKVQLDGGYVAHGGHGGEAAPARLEMATVVEDTVPGYACSRWHAHLYIGPTAVSLIDGRRWPVALGQLPRAVENVSWPFYANRLEALAADLLAVTWGEPQPGAAPEIVDPPWHEHIGAADRGVCPGRWGPRRLLLSDASHLRMAADEERLLADRRARGLEWMEPPLYEPPPLPDPAGS